MKKVLKVLKPYISHSPESSFLFSILSDNENALEWFCSYLLSILIQIDLSDDEFSWLGFYEVYKDCPFVQCCQADYENIKSNRNFSYFVEEMVDKNNYVSPNINKRYISNYNCAWDYNHHMNIYGYDRDEKTIYIADHFRNGKYSFETCTYDEINAAFVAASYGNNGVYLNLNPWITTLNKDEYFNFNPKMIITAMDDFVGGVNLIEKYPRTDIEHGGKLEDYYFGTRYYEAFLILVKGDDFRYAGRLAYLLYAHMKLLFGCITILKRKYNIDFVSEGQNILREANIILILVIKRNCVEKDAVRRITTNLCNRIGNCQKSESSLMIDIMKVLKYNTVLSFDFNFAKERT